MFDLLIFFPKIQKKIALIIIIENYAIKWIN